MFTIVTARPGEAYHKLHPIERLGYAVPCIGFNHELEVAVRVDYSSPDGVFTFKFWLVDSVMGDRHEVMTDEELERRRQQAADNADVYDASNAYPIQSRSGLWAYCQRIEAHFRSMMALNLFQLPINA